MGGEPMPIRSCLICLGKVNAYGTIDNPIPGKWMVLTIPKRKTEYHWTLVGNMIRRVSNESAEFIVNTICGVKTTQEINTEE